MSNKVMTFNLGDSQYDTEIKAFLNAQQNKSAVIKVILHALYKKYGQVDVMEKLMLSAFDDSQTSTNNNVASQQSAAKPTTPKSSPAPVSAQPAVPVTPQATATGGQLNQQTINSNPQVQEPAANQPKPKKKKPIPIPDDVSFDFFNMNNMDNL